MTFNTSAYAIDGARIESSLVRRSLYDATTAAEGISSKSALKVSALGTPGNGMEITGGGAMILNRYLDPSEVNETYTVANEGIHSLTTEEMAGAASSSPVARSFLVCVTVGDPFFSQAGHPWMTSDPIADPENFQYIRPRLISCSASTESFSELNAQYPAYALARLDLPANTTTITNAMLTDLREMAIPKFRQVVDHISAVGTNNLNGAGGTPGAWERWPAVNVIPNVRIPAWAVKVKIMGFVEGARLSKAGNAKLRAAIQGEGLATAVTNVNESAPRNADDRVTYNVGGTIAIPSNLRGQVVNFCLEGTPNNASSQGMLFTTANITSVMLQATFEEEPV